MTRRASSRPLGPDHVWGLGLGFGTVGVFVLRRAVASQLYGVEPTDLSVLAFGALLLSAVALLACVVPPRRATKVDPMVALRAE